MSIPPFEWFPESPGHSTLDLFDIQILHENCCSASICLQGAWEIIEIWNILIDNLYCGCGILSANYRLFSVTFSLFLSYCMCYFMTIYVHISECFVHEIFQQ